MMHIPKCNKHHGKGIENVKNNSKIHGGPMECMKNWCWMKLFRSKSEKCHFIDLDALLVVVWMVHQIELWVGHGKVLKFGTFSLNIGQGPLPKHHLYYFFLHNLLISLVLSKILEQLFFEQQESCKPNLCHSLFDLDRLRVGGWRGSYKWFWT